MKLKLTFVLYLLTALSLTSRAQLCAIDYKSDEFAQFRASKTYFIKSGNAKFDNAAMAALQDSWKITPFAAIESSELKTKITDKSASFIGLVLLGEMNHGYHYLALFNGGKKSIDRYQYDDMIAYAPTNHWVDENELTDCSWRVRNMLEGMIQAIDIVQKNDMKGSSLKLVNGLREYYNAKAPIIKKRTLLISETSMGGKFKPQDFQAAYPFKLEICKREKIEKAIADKSTDYYYLQPGITLNKSWMVVDPSNGEVVYFNYAMMGLNIRDKEIKEMVEFIQK